MKERIARLIQLLKIAPPKKLLAIAGLLVIVAAIPFTVAVQQIQQNLQQEAAQVACTAGQRACGNQNVSPNGQYPYYTNYATTQSCKSGFFAGDVPSCPTGQTCTLTAPNTVTCQIKPQADPNQPVEGQRRCNTADACKYEVFSGGSWGTTQSCSPDSECLAVGGTTGASCRAKPGACGGTAAECTDGQRRCGTDKCTYQVCTGGVWQPSQTCSPDSECLALTTSPGASCRTKAGACSGQGGGTDGKTYQCSTGKCVECVGTACPSVGAFTNSDCIPPGGSANACTSNTLKVSGKVFIDASYSGDPNQASMTGGKIWVSGALNTSVNVTNGAYNLDLGSATSATVRINYEPPIGYSLSPTNTGQESGGQVYVVTVTKDSPAANINIGVVTPPSLVKVGNGSNSITGAAKYLTAGGQRLPLPYIQINLRTASGVLPTVPKVVTDKDGNFKMEGIPTSGSAYELSWYQGITWFSAAEIFVDDKLIGDAKTGTLRSTNIVFTPTPQSFPGMTYIPVDTTKTNTVKVEYVFTKNTTGGTAIPNTVTWDLYQCPKGVCTGYVPIGYPNSGSYCNPSPNYQFTWLSNCPKAPAPGSYSGTLGRDNPAGDVQCEQADAGKIICNTIVQPAECDGQKYVNENQCPSGEMCVDGIGCSAAQYTCISGSCQLNQNGTFDEPTCSNTCSGGSDGGGGDDNNGGVCTPAKWLQCAGELKICSNGQCVRPGDGDEEDPSPSPSSLPGGDTKLAFDIGLDGIGVTGDKRFPNSPGNQDPKTDPREFTVEIFDSNDDNVDTRQESIDYDTSTKRYTATIALKQGFSTGNYLVKVKSPRYLRKLVGGITPLTAGQTKTMPQVNLTAGDIVTSNKIDIADYNVFLSCSVFSKDEGACKSDPDYKKLSDLNDDGLVDQDDYTLLLREWEVQDGD